MEKEQEQKRIVVEGTHFCIPLYVYCVHVTHNNWFPASLEKKKEERRRRKKTMIFSKFVFLASIYKAYWNQRT